jgi:ribosomal subunit interface protein
MKLITKATNISITPDIQDYVDKRLAPVGKLLEGRGIPTFYVELARELHHKNGDVFMAEAKITGARDQYFARAHAGDIFSAIDMLKDELTREVKTGKEKRRSLFRRGAQKIKHMLRFGREA